MRSSNRRGTPDSTAQWEDGDDWMPGCMGAFRGKHSVQEAQSTARCVREAFDEGSALTQELPEGQVTRPQIGSINRATPRQPGLGGPGFDDIDMMGGGLFSRRSRPPTRVSFAGERDGSLEEVENGVPRQDDAGLTLQAGRQPEYDFWMRSGVRGLSDATLESRRSWRDANLSLLRLGPGASPGEDASVPRTAEEVREALSHWVSIVGPTPASWWTVWGDLERVIGCVDDWVWANDNQVHVRFRTHILAQQCVTHSELRLGGHAVTVFWCKDDVVVKRPARHFPKPELSRIRDSKFPTPKGCSCPWHISYWAAFWSLHWLRWLSPIL